MASGCIINMDCPICGEIVWEDDFDIYGDHFIHQGCKHQAILRIKNMTEFEYNQTTQLTSINDDLQVLKKTIKYCEAEVKRLEEMLAGEQKLN